MNGANPNDFTHNSNTVNHTRIRSNPMYPMTALIPAFGDWIIQQQDDRWDVFYINIMFKTLGGSAASIPSQMKRHIESRLLSDLMWSLGTSSR